MVFWKFSKREKLKNPSQKLKLTEKNSAGNMCANERKTLKIISENIKKCCGKFDFDAKFENDMRCVQMENYVVRKKCFWDTPQVFSYLLLWSPKFNFG